MSSPSWGDVIQREGESDFAWRVAQAKAWARAHAPQLLNLVGSVCFAVVVWPHPMPLLGIGCFMASAAISLRRSSR